MKNSKNRSASITSNGQSTTAKTVKTGKGAALAAANDITPAQQAFVEAVESKVSSQFSTQLDGTFQTVNYPSGFNWGVQVDPNGYYNPASLNELDRQVVPGTNGLLTLGSSNFSFLYDQLLNSISYVISAADQQIIDKEVGNASSQVSAVIETWESNFGTITADQIASAKPPSALAYIAGQVTALWGNDPRKIPSTVNDFRAAYGAYQVACAQSNVITSRATVAELDRQAAIANTETPNAANGGLQTGATTFSVGYTGIMPQNLINSGLQTTGTNQVTVSLSLSDFSSSSSSLNVNGGGGITVPIDDIFQVSVNGSANFDLSKYSTSSTTMDISVQYDGITIIGSAPANMNLPGTTGWYANLMLEEGLANMGKGTSVTGYQIQGSEFPPSFFGPGGQLSRLKTFVISQQPVISMVFHSANSDQVKSDFQEKATAEVTFLGIGIGSVSESYEVQSCQQTGTDGSVTVTLGPPTVIGTTPAPKATAFVMGGVVSYPPNLT